MDRKQVKAEAREARKRPPPGQQCECSRHKKTLEYHTKYPEDHPGANADGLKKIYVERGKKLCYGWWCGVCFAVIEPSEFEEGWPVGDDGKFLTPVRCDLIPGVDSRP